MTNENHILKRLAENDYSLFEEQSLRHLSPDLKFRKTISPAAQRRVLNDLKKNYDDQFFFTVDAQRHAVKEKHGVGKWLGYDEETFSLSTYISSIHPTQALMRNIFYYFWMERLLAGDFPIQFMHHRFSTLLSLKHADGNYFYVKQTAYIFQHDNRHRLLEYLNLFTVINDQHEAAYRIRTADHNGRRLNDWERQVHGAVKEALLTSGIFSDMQVKILNHVATHPDDSIKSIATSFGENESNIKTQTTRIRDKINQHFKTEFTKSQQAFSFLISQGLLCLFFFLSKIKVLQLIEEAQDFLADGAELLMG